MRTLALVTVLSAAACATPARQVTATPAPATTTTAKRWQPAVIIPATTTTTVYVSPIPRNRTEACIVARESGGRWYPEPPGDGGQRYQIEAPLWQEYGGKPADRGHASPQEQDAVFEAIVAADGYSPWTRYDGCAA